MSLVFILMLSVVGALIESASIQITRNRKRADTILALESTFAEYHQDLLDQYEVFARLGCTEEVLMSRMYYYGADNMEHAIVQLELLTDDNGVPFYRQAVRYMKDWLGLENMTGDLEYDFSGDGDDEHQEKELSNSIELDSVLQENGEELPTQDNPLKSVKNLKKSNLLSIVVSNQEALSNHSITLETLPSRRELQKGNYPEDKKGSATDKLFFVAYVVEQFSTMADQKETSALLYEQEYLLGGFGSDRENLKAVCKKIMNIRTISNYTYLMTDATRQAEAEAMALTLCSLISLPGITEIVKQALLFAWAYGESIVDMRALLNGKKVPVAKTGSSWQLQLSNLVTLGTENEVVSEKDTEGGLSYQDYLKGLLSLEDAGTLSMRCLDLVESNIPIKTDQCMTKVVIESEANLRRGIRDVFTTTFEYQ